MFLSHSAVIFFRRRSSQENTEFCQQGRAELISRISKSLRSILNSIRKIGTEVILKQKQINVYERDDRREYNLHNYKFHYSE